MRSLPPIPAGRARFTVVQVAALLRTSNGNAGRLVASRRSLEKSRGIKNGHVYFDKKNKCLTVTLDFVVKLRNDRRGDLLLNPDRQEIPRQSEFSPIEAADVLGISARRVRQFCDEGRFGTRRSARSWVIKRKELVMFRANGRSWVREVGGLSKAR